MNPNPQKLNAQIIFVNCSNSYDRKLVNCIRQQIEKDTWLVTSDWALGNLIAPAFPNMVRWNQQYTGDEVISVEPILNSLWS